jgi:hypothetical protein
MANSSAAANNRMLRFFLIAALTGSLQIPARALAQHENPSAIEQQNTDEFWRLIERLEKSEDLEDKIAALEAALELEPQAKLNERQ